MSFTDELSCCKSLGSKIGHTLKVLIEDIIGHFTEHNIDLTMEQYFILNILDDEQGLILQDLAEMLNRDKSAVVRHLNALEQKHFVTRVTCEDDKRKKILLLTKPGLEVLHKAQAVQSKVEEELTGKISEEDLIIFEEVLLHIFKKAQQDYNC